ncbi:hypothetical protein EON83_01435 [bacterium]|nr:MAG: hypothetical protein EON83_01435 [bacterium]
MRSDTKAFLWTQGTLAVLLCASGSIPLTLAKAQEPHVTLPTTQLVQAIHAASSAKVGSIAQVEVEHQKGQTTVGVEILATDGKKYDVSVDASTAKVLSTKIDTADDDTKEEATVTLPTAQLIRAIHAASSAKAGSIAQVEVESEKGQTKVGVEIVAADGQKYDVSVAPSTAKVLSVIADKEDEDESKEGEGVESKDKDDEANDKD